MTTRPPHFLAPLATSIGKSATGGRRPILQLEAPVDWFPGEALQRPENRVRYDLSPQERMVFVKFGKRLSVCDVERYVAGLLADPLFRPDFSEIVDLSDVEELELSSDHALALADMVDPFASQAKRAFIARTRVQIHAARLHQVLRNDVENIRIFSSLPEARQWLKEQSGTAAPTSNPDGYPSEPAGF